MTALMAAYQLVVASLMASPNAHEGVPVGFAVFLGILGVTVLGAVLTPARPSPLGALAAVLSTLPNELAHLWFLMVAASTVVAVTDERLLHGSAGWGVFGIALLLEAVLLVLFFRGLRARPAVAAALSTARLGPLAPRNTGNLLRTLATPLPRRPRAVARTGNIPYGQGDRRQRLDVYRRRDAKASAPVLLYFHGGGYSFGSKRRESRAMLHRFAARGWVGVSVDYRVRPRVSHPEHLVDAKRALACVREHAAELGVDPTHVLVAGSSAGAHLAAQMALTQNEPLLQPGFEAADTSVSAAICLYGHYGPYYGYDGSESPSTAPLSLDAIGAPPFFIVHGDRDTHLPVTAARAMARRLQAVSGGLVVYAELPGAQHAFDLVRSPRSDAVLAGIETFAEHVISDRRAFDEHGGRD
jgi:acetyl esterase/lipase